jgi:hypothetical protein
MAYLLRTLLCIMFVSILITAATAFDLIDLGYSHIQLAIPAFLYTMFIQAFVMFYFIGVARLVDNVFTILSTESNLDELFDEAPEDLTPYMKKVKRYHYQSTLGKRQTIPWTILMLILGSLGFLLGGAHDTGVVSKIVHSGVIYGFLITLTIGFFRQWYYLGKSHRLLRELKGLFGISDDAM